MELLATHGMCLVMHVPDYHGQMKSYVALLRAVNVGGTGKLPMVELRALCATAGFHEVRTYIASGNVVLRSAWPEQKVKAALEDVLAQYAGKQVGVMVRSALEMADVIAANPFPHASPNRCIVVFLDQAPTADTLERVSHQRGEEIELGNREIYVHYGAGMADSKLVVHAARTGTGRNLNTVHKLAEMAAM